MNGNRSATIEYFPEEGYSLRTLYKIIERFLKEGSTTHLSKLGHPNSQKQRDISRKVVKHLFKKFVTKNRVPKGGNIGLIRSIKKYKD